MIDDVYVKNLEEAIEKLEQEKEDVRKELKKHIDYFGEIPDHSINNMAQVHVGDILSGGVLKFNNNLPSFTCNPTQSYFKINEVDIFHSTQSGEFEMGESFKEQIKDLINKTINERETNE